MKLTNSYTLEWFIKIYVFALISKCTGIFNKQMYCIDESTCDIVWTGTNALRRRGVTRWDGIRGKKRVWRPYVRTWDLSEPNALYWRKYLWHCWDFSAPPQSLGAPTITRRPPQWFSAPIAIRSPGNCAPLAPHRYAPTPARIAIVKKRHELPETYVARGAAQRITPAQHVFQVYCEHIRGIFW